MLRVYADFNSRFDDDACWLLRYAGRELSEQAGVLGLSKGDRVVLYEDDFEVIGVLDFRHREEFGRSIWVAVPEWSTLVHA